MTARERCVLAYSGGLDTSVAIRWLQEELGYDVITLTADLGESKDVDAVVTRALAHRCAQRARRRRAPCLRRRLLLSDPRRRCAVRGRLSAGNRAGAPAHRQAARRRRARRGRHRRRARMHRQGQRPGAFRRCRRRARARASRGRAGARLGHGAPPGARVRRAARHRGPGHQGVAVLGRCEPLGAQHRDRRARGSRGSNRPTMSTNGPAHDRAPGVVVRDRVRARCAGLARRAPARRRSIWSPSSTPPRAHAVSVASTTSRTASSASSPARSTRRRRR